MQKLIVYLFVCIAFNGFAQSSFHFDGKDILPGTKKHISVPISDGEHSTLIPITIFHGVTNGPVLGITAGVHGYEYAPILAGQELIETIVPTGLAGTIILVQLANVSGFLGRTPYTNPIDHQNLNRSFPGTSEGTLTDRIAWFISNKIIPQCNYFVDMHSGDAPEDLMPYTAYYQHDDFEKISNVGKQMASYMGFEHVITFKTKGKTYMEKDFPSLYCSAQAFKSGIPAIDIECGRLGIIEKNLVDKIVSGIHSLLGFLKMTIDVPISTESIIFIENRTYQTSNHSGLFYPTKRSGQYVSEGMQIGYVTDFFKRKIAQVNAETAGIILYMLGTPPVNKGETLVAIGILNNRK